MNKKILLIGGGGHCKSVLDSLLELAEYNEIGIVDEKLVVGSLVMGIQVVGRDKDLHELFENGYKFAFVTIGSIGNPSIRRTLTKVLTKSDLRFHLLKIDLQLLVNLQKLKMVFLLGK